MLARVTTWEGGTADGIRAASDEMQANVSKGPPPGLKSNGITMLADPDGGRIVMVGMFETQEDLDESLPVLKQMDPPAGMGTMTSAHIYEVIADVRM